MITGANLVWCLFWTTMKVMGGLYPSSSSVQAALMATNSSASTVRN